MVGQTSTHSGDNESDGSIAAHRKINGDMIPESFLDTPIATFRTNGRPPGWRLDVEYNSGT